MKKQFLTFALAAGALALTSCSDDFAPDFPGGDGVSFRVELPGGMTRAFGDGLSATNLKYAVYQAEDGEFISQGTANFPDGSLSTTITLSGENALLQGKSYKIAFFAYKNSSVYTFDAENAKVKVNYSQMIGSYNQTNDHDAFYGLDEFTVDGAMNRSVTLTRPMAQVNFGTDDYDYNTNEFVNQAYGSNLRCMISTTASDELNLLTGEANEPTAEVKSGAPHKPITATYGTFPGGDSYQWLTMTYILLPKEAPVIDIKFTTHRSSNTTPVNTIDVTNVPVERNFRTNIYGSLLTSPANLTITKSDVWSDAMHNVPVWRGEVKTPTPDANGNYSIKHPAELAGIAQMVNSGNQLKGVTVTLANDIDLANLEWTPIGTTTQPFSGTFDGAGHTISNLSASLKGKAFKPLGLFGQVSNGGIVKDFTIDGATIDGTGYTGATGTGTAAVVGRLYTGKSVDNVVVKNANVKAYRHAGIVVGHAYGNVTNCRVIDSQIAGVFEPVSGGFDNADKVGGVLGYAAESGGGTYNHSGNSVENVRVEGYRHVGAVFGYVHSGTVYSNCSATNSTVVQNLDHNYNNIAAGTLIGKIAGWNVNSNSVDNGGSNSNSATSVELLYPQTVTSTAAAISLLQNGGIVEAGADLDFTSIPGTLAITRPTTIIIPAGKTIKVGDNQIQNHSQLTIKGEGNYVSAGLAIFNGSDGTLTIESGNITAGTSGQYVNHAVHSEGNLIINGGTFTTTTTSKASYAVNLNAANVKTPVKVEINGGTFISRDAYAANFYGTTNASMPAEIVVNGGTFIGANGGGMASNSVDLTINGGSFLTTGKYHGFYLAPENFGANMSRATINGGNFYGGSGYSIGANSQSRLTVKGGYVNKTSGFTPAAGYSLQAASKSISADGKTWNFTHKIAK